MKAPDQSTDISVELPVEIPRARLAVTGHRRRKTSSTLVRAGVARRGASLASGPPPRFEESSPDLR